MRKKILLLVGIILVLSMVLTSTGSAIAAPLGGGPTISAPSGGGTVTLTQIAVKNLPGTEANAAGTLFPIGHTSGDLMFSSSGVQVSGLVGSATLSLPLANYAEGWNGSVYQWLNNTWVKIPTTVTQNNESADGTAAATIYSDGIYALIVSYKVPEVVASNCPGEIQLMPVYAPSDGSFAMLGIVILGYTNENWLQEGDIVTYKITNISTGSYLEGPLNSGGPVMMVESMGDTYAAIVLMGYDYIFTYEESPTFTLTVNINGCRLRADFPEEWYTGG